MSVSGTNNPFSCQPVLVGNNNAILELGTITRVDDTFTFSIGFKWRINSITYQNSVPFEITILPASTGFKRIDVAILNTNNQIELLSGSESESIALQPTIPVNAIILTSWNIDGDTIDNNPDPILGDQYVKKIYSSPYSFNGSGSDAVIPLDNSGKSEVRLTNPALVSIAGIDDSAIPVDGEQPFPNKIISIRNLTGHSITIKHELGSSVKPFYLNASEDLVFPNNEIIDFFYDLGGLSEKFKSWNSSSGSYFTFQLPSFAISRNATAVFFSQALNSTIVNLSNSTGISSEASLNGYGNVFSALFVAPCDCKIDTFFSQINIPSGSYQVVIQKCLNFDNPTVDPITVFNQTTGNQYINNSNVNSNTIYKGNILKFYVKIDIGATGTSYGKFFLGFKSV